MICVTMAQDSWLLVRYSFIDLVFSQYLAFHSTWFARAVQKMKKVMEMEIVERYSASQTT